MKKLLLISHVADEDGLTTVILAKFVFKEVDTLLLNPGEVDEELEKRLDDYDLIHITDLSISDDLAQKIDKNYKDKVLIFDHHKSADYLNKYDFAKVIEERNGRKESATSLYYEYLCQISDNKILRKKSTKGLVNEVRKIDTYDFKDEQDKENSLRLDYLFSILGRKNYINYFTKYLKKHNTFEYTKQEKYLINLQKEKINNYIEARDKEVIFANLDNHKIAISYAESNRSLLGNYLVNKYDIDYAIIININRSLSFRGKDKVDLSVISQKYNGGGHPNASGAPLPENLKEKITKLIFKNIEIKEEDK